MTKPKEKIRILIVDDHTLFRKGIISMLADIPHIQFIAEAVDGNELITSYLSLKPDMILADIAMKPLKGTEAVQKLLEMGLEPKTLFLSMYSEEDSKLSCYLAGGMGLIGKDISKKELLLAIETVNSGQIYFGPDWTEEKILSLSKKLAASYKNNISGIELKYLSVREKSILRAIVEGKTSLQIAEELSLGKRTIDSYRSNLFKKVNVKTLSELISYGLKHYEELFEGEDINKNPA